MGFWNFLLKTLLILAMVLLIAAPFLMEYFTFCRDKNKKISYKRFRIVVYTCIYVIFVTVVLCLAKDLLLAVGSLPVIQWLAGKVAFGARIEYCVQVFAAILINFFIGLLYVFFSKFIRIGLKKKNLLVPKRSNSDFSWGQKAERRIIRFFYSETWFFVGRIVKWLSVALSAVYALIFILYQIPALSRARWLSYPFISSLFTSGYIFPVITLLALWEFWFFLEGIRRLEDECPELIKEKEQEYHAPELDLGAIDNEIKKQFRDYYECDVDMSPAVHEEIAVADRHPITRLIGKAVENDERNPQPRNETYLDCIDKLVTEKKGLLINGSLFSGFSQYFIRYLSAVIARGDNAVFICNNDMQIAEIYDYLIRGFSEITSLCCKGFTKDAVDFDEPIWRVIKISGERSVLEEASIDDNNILITSLAYLCSNRFEAEHSRFIMQTDAVVFVDTLNTVNLFNRQLSILNTRFKHITKTNSLNAKNKGVKEAFRVRYLSRQVRYICFDDSRTPGLDKVLKNLLSVGFESVDIMRYYPKTMVRCYRYEGTPDENGRRVCPQFFNTEEEIGALINMAVLCLAKGASNVAVFTDNVIPYGNIAESVAANAGQIAIKADANKIRLNKPLYNPAGYSVIIAMDSGDNLPAAIRKYSAMVSQEPTLVIIFSKPYMMRDFYLRNIDSVWSFNQLERIPVEEKTKKDAAQKILIRANSGGISTDEVFRMTADLPGFEKFAEERNIKAILRAIVRIYDDQEDAEADRLDLFRNFQFVSTQDFDENGKYRSEDRIILRRSGKLFEKINGRDMIVMKKGDSEVILPLPRSRITQNFIAGQNFLYNGEIYHINSINTETGTVVARLAVGGKNDEVYRYIPSRLYHLEFNDDTRSVFPTKHVVIGRAEEDVSVGDVYVSVFRTTTEVLTKGYYEIDPHSLAVNVNSDTYHSISDPGNDDLAKQTYRRYGKAPENAFYSTDVLLQSGALNCKENGALVMSVRICGQFGEKTDQTAALAAAMLNELFRSMFPSAADSVAVCPVFHQTPADEESLKVLRVQPHLTFDGESELICAEDFNLVIIEDCAADLGVVSMLMSAGDDVLKLLFAPVFKYLQWYLGASRKSDYLYYGLDHEPACFDFLTLYKLAKILGDTKYDMSFVDIDTLIEYNACDFCGRHFSGTNETVELEDGRKMCRECADNLVGNNKNYLKSVLEHARRYLESVYGITLGDDYEFCFESTVRIANTLRMNPNLIRRGADAPLKSYTDDRKKVHVEYSVPPASLAELLVRELTHVWQMKHLPELEEELAEGHIALVAVQFLRFLSLDTIAATRASYYESTGNPSGLGYRRLVRELLNHPQYRNNPFRYLLGISGAEAREHLLPAPRICDISDFGRRYQPKQPDRAFDGRITYFYYARLEPALRKAYDMMLACIRNFDASVIIEGCTFDDIRIVSEAIEYDHPELFWYRNFAMAGSEVKLLYGAGPEEAAALQKKIDAVAAEYLKGIDNTMSAYDVAVRLHIKVISTVDYDTLSLNRERSQGGPAEDKIDYLRSICGVFLDGKAVCEGYARAMQYLLQRCGIECAEVCGNIRKDSGESPGAHAWNIVRIDGDYYHLDTTWDDDSNTIQSVKNTDPGFDYFLVTEEEIRRTRDLKLCPTSLPPCTATRANYYYHNDLVLEKYDAEKLKTIAKTAAETGKKLFSVKCASKAVFDRILAKLSFAGEDDISRIIRIAAKSGTGIDGNSFHYTCDNNIRTVTVKFSMK